ncbi:hypothetical protein [Lignipirellula cremea]|nr:hypothetical protein [Lignipirellula cremea]
MEIVPQAKGIGGRVKGEQVGKPFPQFTQNLMASGADYHRFMIAMQANI